MHECKGIKKQGIKNVKFYLIIMGITTLGIKLLKFGSPLVIPFLKKHHFG